MAITSPKDIPGLVVWWSAEAQSSRFADGQAITDRIWDSSGNNYHGMIQGAASGVTYEATTGPAGGPALKFNGGYAEVWRAYDLTLKNAAAGEIMATIKNDMLQTDTTQGGPWRFGTDANGGLYVSNGTLYEGFASTARKSGAVVDDTTIWNRYNVWSAPSDFSAQINGVARITTGTNTVAWHATPLIGSNGATNFIGHFGCVVMYSRKLTAAERTDLDAWLQANPSGGAPNSALPPPDPQQSAAQYINMNVGISQTPDPDGVQYVNMNVGVKITTDPDGVQYVNLNVIDPPDTMFISDGKKWYGVVLDYQLDQGLANAKQDAELYAGALVTQQGNPSGGNTGQVLTKVSDKNYDYKWATPASGGPGGLPAGGAGGDLLVKGSSLDGDASWGKAGLDHISDVDLTTPPTDGQVLVYDGTAKKWKPAGKALAGLTDVDLTTAPADQQVLKYDAASKRWKAGSDLAGAGGALALDKDLNATYGDDFNGPSLDAKWTRAGSAAAGNETFADGALLLKFTPTANQSLWRYTQPAPSGDFSIVMKCQQYGKSNTMIGPFIVDSGGAGVGASPYMPSGTEFYTWVIAANAYSSTGANSFLPSSLAQNGITYWIRLRKAGTNYYGAMSYDGLSWLEWGAQASSITPAKIGFGNIYASTQAAFYRIFRFNVE